MEWAPTLDDLKVDLGIPAADTREDARLAQSLEAAIDFVERVRPGFKYDPTDAAQILLPVPPNDLILGTLRYAGRLHSRRRSPDGMVSMGELGSTRVSTGDGDIDRLLRIGRHQKARVG